MSSPSFVNGIIVGAGVVMALMSVGFLYYVAPLENREGITTTEIRVAIFLGGIVAAVALAYEFYSKKDEPKLQETEHDEPLRESSTPEKTDEHLPDESAKHDESQPEAEPKQESIPEPEPPEESDNTKDKNES